MGIRNIQQTSYKGRPFLVPRDVYLANNRVILDKHAEKLSVKELKI